MSVSTPPFHVVVGAGATGVATAEAIAESGERVRLTLSGPPAMRPQDSHRHR